MEIAKICDQTKRYEKYRERKIMDEISYMEQTNRLKARLSELRSRRIKLMRENEETQMVEKLCELKEILQEYPKAIIDFDSTMFDDIVEKIVVGHDGTLEFCLKGNLHLSERIEVIKKCA